MSTVDHKPLPNPVLRRDFLTTTASFSAAALAAADSRLALAQSEAAKSAPLAGSPATTTTPRWEFGSFEDLRSYARELERRGLLLKVRNIDQDRYEGTALMYRLIDRFGMYFAPALLMENVKTDGV